MSAVSFENVQCVSVSPKISRHRIIARPFIFLGHCIAFVFPMALMEFFIPAKADLSKSCRARSQWIIILGSSIAITEECEFRKYKYSRKGRRNTLRDSDIVLLPLISALHEPYSI